MRKATQKKGYPNLPTLKLWRDRPQAAAGKVIGNTVMAVVKA